MNSINSLTDVVFGPLVESALIEGSKIYMAGNPIQCDCSLSWVAKNPRFLYTVNGAKCDGGGLAIADVSFEEFRKCPPHQPWKSPTDKLLESVKEEESA